MARRGGVAPIDLTGYSHVGLSHRHSKKAGETCFNRVPVGTEDYRCACGAIIYHFRSGRLITELAATGASVSVEITNGPSSDHS